MLQVTADLLYFSFIPSILKTTIVVYYRPSEMIFSSPCVRGISIEAPFILFRGLKEEKIYRRSKEREFFGKTPRNVNDPQISFKSYCL